MEVLRCTSGNHDVDPFCCTADTSLEEVAKAMVEHDCGEIPIVRKQQGQNAHRRCYRPRHRLPAGRARQESRGRDAPNPACRRRSLPSARRRRSRTCARIMEESQIRRVPVSTAAECAVESSLRPTSRSTPRERSRQIWSRTSRNRLAHCSHPTWDTGLLRRALSPLGLPLARALARRFAGTLRSRPLARRARSHTSGKVYEIGS